MPVRKNTSHILTPEVQEPDGWVDVVRPTVDDMTNIMKEFGGETASENKDPLKNLEAGKKMVQMFVRDWNWVDNEGEPLPTPKADPTVVGRLTDQELYLLMDKLTPDDTDLKKKRKG